MERKNLKLAVKNFGPIREGEVEFKPLTVFIGPNNSGKSYMATLLYSLARSLTGGVRPPFLPSSYSDKEDQALRGCFQSLEHVLNLMNETQIIPQRPDRQTVGYPRSPTSTGQARWSPPHSGPARGGRRHPVCASERMSMAHGSPRSASLADSVQILPRLDYGWHMGTNQ